MQAQTILFVIIGILIVSWVFDQLLSYLNLQSHTREVPSELSSAVDADQYAKAYDYHHVRYRFGLLRSIISFVAMLAILAFGVFGWWDGILRTYTSHYIALPLLFFGSLAFISDVLTIPFQWYSVFTIEERFGFNKMTPKTFWMDKLKGYALGIIMGGLVLGVLLYLVEWLGSGFWIWFWVFMTLFSLVMNVFYTSWIMPLFNKLIPLESGDLRSSIEKYSNNVQFPLDNILVMDGSRRSSKSNAFFSGLGKRKKVVLFDTLIEQHSEDELVAVLAHEVGHYKRKHIIKNLVIGIAQSGLMLFILSLFISTPTFSQALGASENGIHLNLIAFGLLYSPFSTFIGLGMNLLSRKYEYEADHYAATTFKPEPLKSALIGLHENNLANLTPHPWYVFMNYSHPTLLQRLRAIGN